MSEQTLSHAEQNAANWLENIEEELAALDREEEGAEDRIHEGPLSIEVREAWHFPNVKGEVSEYQILLSTGGPALRVRGELVNGEPTSAELEWQDWGTTWTTYSLNAEQSANLMRYVSLFYYGE